MKMLIPALSILFYSSLSLAGYTCTGEDSKFLLTKKPSQVVVVQMNNAVTLSGHQEDIDSNTINVENFVLQDLKGAAALLKISTHYDQNEDTPCHGRRSCDNFFTTNITAELDYQGKITLYKCIKNLDVL